MTRIALALAVGASMTLLLASTPAALAGKSGLNMGKTGGSPSSGTSLGGGVVSGKGATGGGFASQSGMNEPTGSRRDRRGQDPMVAPSPPPDVKPIRGWQVRCDGHRCGPYNPFQEYPNRRAQVRDHRD